MNHFKHSVGAPLHATEVFPTRQSQIQRFMKQGWPLVHCPTLNFFYYDTLPEKEKVRLQDLEPFDEFEVMIKMLRCIILTFSSVNCWLFADLLAAGST